MLNKHSSGPWLEMTRRSRDVPEMEWNSLTTHLLSIERAD